ncbi:MAG TPA: TlpA disulfide reductase family protein [Bryobacteraceae bacterium]|nr:TlpA disulfide reductase family protein [Bryobacteraceae bacterium]
MKFWCIAIGLLAVPALFGQGAPVQMSQDEQTSLTSALGEAGNSPVDFIRAIEAHLQKFPNSPRRADLEKALVKTAIQLKDNDRIMRFGESVLQREPNDLSVLQSVAVALLQTGGKPNCELALKHAEHMEKLVEEARKMPPPVAGRDEARQIEDYDRLEATAVLLEGRARGLLGQTDMAIHLARKSFDIYPNVESARESARWLSDAGQSLEAVQYLADAFSIAQLHAAEPDPAHDRDKMGSIYRTLNGSEAGLGDLILKAYDRTSALFTARRQKLQGLDPNAQLTDPLQFTVTDVAGGKLQLASLKGKVIIMDFWATWCGPCRAQHPLYEQAKERFKDHDDVIFLSIDTDEDHGVVKPFLESNKWTQKVYFDDGLARLLQATSIPMTIIFNKNGEIYSRMNGYIPERFVDMLSDRINAALQGKKAATAIISQ